MSWRDGQSFAIWLEEQGVQVDFEQLELLRRAYEAGYEKGFKEGRSYDPMWDAD